MIYIIDILLFNLRDTFFTCFISIRVLNKIYVSYKTLPKKAQDQQHYNGHNLIVCQFISENFQGLADLSLHRPL